MQAHYTGVMAIIYILTFPNGKCYVGQTIQPLNRRLAFHRRQAARADRKYQGNLLYAAWKKYGHPQVSFTPPIPPEILDTAEIDYIRLLKSQRPNGYNVLPGGKSRRWDEETRRKLSVSATWRMSDPTARQKIAAGLIRHFSNKEAREAVSRQHTPERRAATAAKNKTRVWTDEARKAIGDKVRRRAEIKRRNAHW